MLSQAFYVIIDRGISAPGNSREVVDDINTIDKRFLFHIISTVKFLGAKGYDTQMIIHTGTHLYDVSLARDFQKHLSTAARKHGVID